jgi:uncharacterized membrane protein YuzA (DUF378 family)
VHTQVTRRRQKEVKALNVLALILVIVGALNWGLVAIAEFDLVAEIFGEEFGTTNAVTRIVYGLVGLAGVYLAVTLLPAILRSDDRVALGRDNPHSAR